MRTASALLVALAVALAGNGEQAFAQQEEARVVPPPPIVIVPAPPPIMARRQSTVSPSAIAEATALCTRTTSLTQTFDPRPLVEAGWRVEGSQERESGLGSYTMRGFGKGDLLAIAREFSASVDTCSIVTDFTKAELFEEVTAALVNELGAQPLDEAEGYDGFRDHLARSTLTQPHAFLVLGEHVLEVETTRISELPVLVVTATPTPRASR